MKISTVQQTRNILQQYLQFLKERNLDEILPLFAERVDWYVPGNTQNVPWGGTGKRKAKDEIRQFFEQLWENTVPLDATVEHMLIEGNLALITGCFRTKMLKTRKVVDSLFSIQITIENDLIVKYRVLEDSYAVAEAMTN